jgi:5-formyltetrahydrofolate cyclo-ligase
MAKRAHAQGESRLAATAGPRARAAGHTPRKAATIKGAGRSARTVGLDDMEPVDLVIAGCVAVGEDGRRLGKGGGFSDLELAVATAAGLISSRTVIATTVHDVQVVASGRVPVTDHDFVIDVIVTPTRVLRPRRSGRRKRSRLDWSALSEEKIASIPLLTQLRHASR